MNLTRANIDEAELDLRKLNDPAYEGFNLLYSDGYFAKSLEKKWGMSLEELGKQIAVMKQDICRSSGRKGVYRQCKKWHMKLTELDDVVSGLPFTTADRELVSNAVRTIQKKLSGMASGETNRQDGKVTHEEKRKNVIGLAIVNPTLSMSAIARHFGYSEAFVAKVTKEYGRVICEEQNTLMGRTAGGEAR